MKHGDENVEVQVYGDDSCGWTHRARAILDHLGVDFEYIDLRAPGAPTTKAELKADTGWRTQPWIFIRGKLIGGCTDLIALIQNGDYP